MRFKGQDVNDAILEWAKEELKGGPTRTYDLGKFLFTVSSGTAGLVVAIQKLGGLNQYVHRKTLISALILLAVSICISLDMVRPRVWNTEADLHDEYDKHIKRFIKSLRAWVVIWGIGAILGIISVMF